MTIKEKLETIKGKKIAIWCENREEAKDLVKNMDLVTNQIDSPIYFDSSNTCYDLFTVLDWDFGEIDWYERNEYEIISYCEFMESVNKAILSQSDINAILDEKYGKDNWVIK